MGRVSLGTLTRDIVRARNAQMFVAALTDELDFMGVVLNIPCFPYSVVKFCVVNRYRKEVSDFCSTWEEALKKADDLNRRAAA
jgi:hypothetical protein